MNERQTLVLYLAVALGLGACSDNKPQAPAQSPATAYTLDESKLPPFNRFQPTDLDPAKQACDDFAGYVNGKWLAANPIPGDRVSWGPADILIERSLAVQHQLAEQAAANMNATGVDKIVGDFWATGMDEARINAQGIEPLKTGLAEIEALTDGPAVAGYLRESAGRGENLLFEFYPSPDFRNSSMNIAYAWQGGLGLPERGYYFDVDKQDKLAAYRTHVAKVLELSGVPAADAAAQSKDVVAFEVRLAKVSKSREEQRDVSLRYNPVSPADADTITPNFSWTAFFESQGIAAPATFSLAIPAFHQEVSRMLGDVPVATWRAYLRFRAVDDASPYLSEPFVQESYDFYRKTLRGQKEQQARWKRVLGTIENQAGEALGQLFVKVAFPPEAKAKMDTLVGNLRIALKSRIGRLDWMSDETKKKAIEKWVAFTPKIGYPDKWRDWAGLVTSRDSYFGNVRAARAFNYEWNLGKIGKPVDRTEWARSPQTVNAYYSPQRNEIVFPAAILQPPFFDMSADDATNYGAIGAVIGHELTHGYDDQGSRFGPTGNFENWWTPADAKAFSSRTVMVVQQFNGYIAAPGLQVNGKLTLGENIADLGGLNTAHDAMKMAVGGAPDPMTDGLSHDQRFFLNFATFWRRQLTPDYLKLIVNSDTHAPSNFRAIGAPSNMPAFAAAFSCKEGSPMVRPAGKRVVIW